MSYPHVYKRRLLKLAAFLENLPEERFSYAIWAGSLSKHHTCGTSGCALGWAASLRDFRRLGLRLEKEALFGSIIPVDTVNGARKEESAMRIFGLSETEASFLFIPNELNRTKFRDLGMRVIYTFGYTADRKSPAEDATTKEVAEHIRAFVAAKYPDKPKLSGKRQSSSASE